MLIDAEPPPEDEPTEDYVGRHRLPESHPDHGRPLDRFTPPPHCPEFTFLPCGHVAGTAA